MDRYELHITGALGARHVADLDCTVVGPALPGRTCLRTGPLDPTGLYGLVSRLRDAGVALVEVRRLPQPDMETDHV